MLRIESNRNERVTIRVESQVNVSCVTTPGHVNRAHATPLHGARHRDSEVERSHLGRSLALGSESNLPRIVSILPPCVVPPYLVLVFSSSVALFCFWSCCFHAAPFPLSPSFVGLEWERGYRPHTNGGAKRVVKDKLE